MFVRLVARLAVLVTGIAVALASGMTLAQDSRSGLLWEVSSPSTQVFLVGTIHVGSRDLYPLPAAIEAAYAKASAVALEVDLSSEQSIAAVGSLFLYPPPDNLEQHVPPELFRDAVEILQRFGLPADMARAMKPQMLSMALTLFEAGRTGLDAALGLDIHLTRRAHADGKRVVELESVAIQAELLDNLSAPVQIAMLESTVRGIRDGTLAKELASLVAAWKRGDGELIQQIAAYEMSRMPDAVGRELEQRMFLDRNAAMAARVETMLAGREVVLVAVGAAHMTGDHGLVRTLRDRGYDVVQRLDDRGAGR